MHEVSCVYGASLDVMHNVVSRCLSIVEDLREEGVLVVGGRHDREEIVGIELTRLIIWLLLVQYTSPLVAH